MTIHATLADAIAEAATYSGLAEVRQIGNDQYISTLAGETLVGVLVWESPWPAEAPLVPSSFAI